METYNCHKLLMEIQAYSFPGLTITTSFMLGVAPVINLILVLNWKRLKQKLSSALLLICKIVPSTADSDQLEDFVT